MCPEPRWQSEVSNTCKWGVRNSSMMLFSSVAQRATDNDKRSEASSSAALLVTFYSLSLPGRVLLQELAEATCYRVLFDSSSLLTRREEQASLYR